MIESLSRWSAPVRRVEACPRLAVVRWPAKESHNKFVRPASPPTHRYAEVPPRNSRWKGSIHPASIRNSVQQVVDYRSPYPHGTVIVDPHRRFLYLIQKDNKPSVRRSVSAAKGSPLRVRAPWQEIKTVAALDADRRR